jgi:dTMP kinase
MPHALPQGVLLAFEGIDGSGKSTQARRFADWAAAQGLDVVRSREPTDGPWGRRIREARFTARLSPEEELHAFLEDRRQHVEGLIAPSLARGAVVVVDRYYYSTVAYQGARGFDPEALLARNRAFAPRPHLVVLVDVTPDVALERIEARGEGRDLFETREALAAVRRLFLEVAKEPHVAVIDGAQEPAAVFGEVLWRILSGPLAGWAKAQPHLARALQTASAAAPARQGAAFLEALGGAA